MGSYPMLKNKKLCAYSMLMNLLQEPTKNLASQSCGGAMSTIAPSMPSHDCPGSSAGGPRRGFVPQAPTVKMCVSAGAPAATLRPILYSRGHSRVLVCVSLCFLHRSLLPAAPPASPLPPPLPRPRHDRTCLIRCNLLSFLISAATAGGRTTVQTVSAAAKTLPTTPTRER